MLRASTPRVALQISADVQERIRQLVQAAEVWVAKANAIIATRSEPASSQPVHAQTTTPSLDLSSSGTTSASSGYERLVLSDTMVLMDGGSSDDDDEMRPSMVRATSDRGGRQNSVSLEASPMDPTVPVRETWNSRFQKLVEVLIRRQSAGHYPIERNMREHKRFLKQLLRLNEDFVWTAQTYGKIIITELYESQKRIRPLDDVLGTMAVKYIAQNIFFKVACDKEHFFQGVPRYAAKTAGHELKGAISFSNTLTPGLNFPLMCNVDYLGHRLNAIAVLPVPPKGAGLILGMEDGKNMHFDVAKGAETLNGLISQAAKKINLRLHYVRLPDGREIEISGPADLEGHLGIDNKFYILDFARTMPPSYADESVWQKLKFRHLFQLLRPEILSTWGEPLCSDSFSMFMAGSESYRRDTNKLTFLATMTLEKRLIPKFVRETLIPEIDDARLNRQLQSYRITRAMHRSGINMRYLGLVYKEVPRENRECRLIVFIEALSRQCKINLRERLQTKMTEIKVPVLAPYLRTTVGFYNLVFGNSAKSAIYHRRLVEQLAENFDLRLDLAAERVDDLRSYVTSSRLLHGPHLLFNRLMEATGTRFSARGFCKFGHYAFALSISSDSESAGSVTVGASGPPNQRLSAGGSVGLGRDDLRNLCDLTLQRWNSATPFDDSDILGLDVMVKHMGIISAARAERFLIDGLSALSDKQYKHNSPASYYFERSLRYFEEALDANSTNLTYMKHYATAIERHIRSLQMEQKIATVSIDHPFSVKLINQLRTILQRDPTCSYTLALFAKFLYRCGDHLQGLEYTIQAIENDVAAYECYSELSSILMANPGAHARCLDDLQIALDSVCGKIRAAVNCLRDPPFSLMDAELKNI